MSGLPSWARKGVKVVCVDAQSRWGLGLAEGEVYTVQSVVPRDPTAAFYGRGVPSEWEVTLVEVSHPDHPDYGFVLNRFRPLVEPKTEAEDLKAHFLPLLSGPVEATTLAPVEGADA